MNKTTFKLAFKNLTRQKRRNAVLAMAIAFGFFIVTTIDGLISGMVSNMEELVTQLTGGTVLIQGLEISSPTDAHEVTELEAEAVSDPAISENPEQPSGSTAIDKTPEKKKKAATIIRDREYLQNLIDSNHIKYKYVSKYTYAAGQMIFNGKKSFATVYGYDFENSHIKDSFQLTAGSLDNLAEPNAIVVSEKFAESLDLQIGDQMTFSTFSINGQGEVGDFTVGAIIKANTFVNTMMAYADIETVNRIIGIPEGGYTTFTIFLENKNHQAKVADKIEALIRKDGKNVTSRKEAMRTNPTNVGRGIEKQVKPELVSWEGTKYAVETLYDEVPAIRTVLNVVHIITTTILLVILLIVMVGVSNTYRMVLYERIREIGTMRALGMTGKATGETFTAEAVILCLIGALTGFIVSGIAMFAMHMLVKPTESIAMFLHNGHLSFKLSPVSIIIQYLLLILLTILAVRGSAKQAASLSPAEALRTVK